MIIKPVDDYEDHYVRLIKLEKNIFPKPMVATKAHCAAMADMVKRHRYFAWDVFSGSHCVASTSFWIQKARGGPLFATLNSTAIVEKHRGQGLYHELLKLRIDQIKTLDLPFFEVQCASDNPPMINFWGKMLAEGKVRAMKV